MSKKVISILLSGAMLVSMFCVGFGALTASAADDTSTFYFLAPRTEGTNYFAKNDEIGYWYWGGTAFPEGTSWPGPLADKAEEVGKDVYKITIPDDETGLVFNAHVDAGEADEAGNYADPATAAVAFQTQDITDIEVFGDTDNRNKIYVLDLSTTTEGGKPKTAGSWYSIDPTAADYYRLSDAYKAYNIENDTATPDTATPGDSDTTSKPSTDDKKYSSGSSVTVTYKVGGINDLGSISSVITYNADVLELDTAAYTDKRGNGVWYEKGEVKPNVAINSTDAGVEIGVLTEDGEFGSDFTDETTLVTVAFKAKADFNKDDLGIALNTTKFMEVTENGSVDITDKAGDYVSIDVTLPEAKPVKPDTDTSSDTSSANSSVSSTTSSEKATDSDKKETKDPSSDSSKTTSSSTTSTSTKTTGTTSTVQTAGTFAVLSLVVILMAAAGVVIYTRKKTEE